MRNSGGGVTHPLLIECDRDGRVVWMSHQAQTVLGEAPLERGLTERLRAGESFRIWAAYVTPEILLMAAQAESELEEAPVRLADKLLVHYFRLEQLERKIETMRQVRMAHRAMRAAPALRQVERERQRLGRELHTGVGQMLAAIRMQLESVVSQMQNPAEAVQKALERIGALSEEALEQVRGISRRLYPPDWQRHTLEEALRRLWESAGIPQRFAARLQLAQLEIEPDLEIKILLYRTAQEAVSNIARHSGASRVEMTLETIGDRIVLTVRDDGRGFDAGAPSTGIGLRSVRDAAAETGADFEVVSAPGGTTLRISSPFEAR